MTGCPIRGGQGPAMAYLRTSLRGQGQAGLPKEEDWIEASPSMESSSATLGLCEVSSALPACPSGLPKVLWPSLTFRISCGNRF